MNDTTQPRFAVDHMLIKLGKYLRIAGCDAVWDKSIRTHELIDRANAEGRTFLTRNTRLQDQYPPVKHLLPIQADDPVEQLGEVVRATQLDVRRRLFTRCVRCNVALDTVPDKKQVEGCIHPNVFRRYEDFYTCPSCGTVFWKGSHVRNTCRKLGIGEDQCRKDISVRSCRPS